MEFMLSEYLDDYVFVLMVVYMYIDIGWVWCGYGVLVILLNENCEVFKVYFYCVEEIMDVFCVYELDFLVFSVVCCVFLLVQDYSGDCVVDDFEDFIDLDLKNLCYMCVFGNYFLL